jgi:hypothetical protein
MGWGRVCVADVYEHGSMSVPVWWVWWEWWGVGEGPSFLSWLLSQTKRAVRPRRRTLIVLRCGWSLQEIRERLMDELKNKRVLVSGDRTAPHLVIGPMQVCAVILRRGCCAPVVRTEAFPVWMLPCCHV